MIHSSRNLSRTIEIVGHGKQLNFQYMSHSNEFYSNQSFHPMWNNDIPAIAFSYSNVYTNNYQLTTHYETKKNGRHVPAYQPTIKSTCATITFSQNHTFSIFIKANRDFSLIDFIIIMTFQLRHKKIASNCIFTASDTLEFPAAPAVHM